MFPQWINLYFGFSTLDSIVYVLDFIVTTLLLVFSHLTKVYSHLIRKILETSCYLIYSPHMICSPYL